MIWMYLLISLTIPRGTSAVSSTFHQTQERNNLSISWDSKIKFDLSLANLVCVSLSETPKVWYQMINGVESPESQHQQFAGRVQLDKDALREGRVSLHLSAVTAEDSGNYWCELTANYDKTTMRWGFLDTGHFVLNVPQNKDGESSDESLSTPRFGQTPAEDAKRRQQEVPRDSRSIVAPIILAVLVVGALLWAMLTSPPIDLSGDHQEELTQIETSMKSTWTSKLSHTIKGFLHHQRTEQMKQQPDVFQV